MYLRWRVLGVNHPLQIAGPASERRYEGHREARHRADRHAGSLVLGLLIASANGKFETESSQIKQLTANIVLLDGALKLYGSETDGLRNLMRREVAAMADGIWRENAGSGKAQTFEATDLGMSLYNEVFKLSPKTEAQRFLQTKAIDAITDVGKTRLLLFTNAGGRSLFPFLLC